MEERVQPSSMIARRFAVVGDHADSNRLFAAKIDEENGGRPFIGCYAHRLNLAAKNVWDVLVTEKLVKKVQKLARWGKVPQR